jgi:tRNA pseudouridine55 synthase
MISGMLLFDKPPGWTSHDAAQAFRRMLPKDTKVGHCGSLDPIATGLLILLVGPLTKLQARMQKLDKVYSGLLRLGVQTDTGDIAGKVVAEKQVPPLTIEKLRDLLISHQGTLEMPAPAYSAVKHQGRALYYYARKGIEVPPKPRKSTVHRWEAVSYEAPILSHRLSCSSGTYVRSLAELLGERLGCGATVLTLRRDSIADFSTNEALCWEKAKEMSRQELLAALARSFDRLKESKILFA